MKTPAKLSASYVSALLRDRSRWPADFTWDYNDTAHCAIGLLYQLGLIEADITESCQLAFKLDMSLTDVNNIFLQAHWEHNIGPCPAGLITPENIADMIDKTLQRGFFGMVKGVLKHA